jgi:hypothetical protein
VALPLPAIAQPAPRGGTGLHRAPLGEAETWPDTDYRARLHASPDHALAGDPVADRLIPRGATGKTDARAFEPALGSTMGLGQRPLGMDSRHSHRISVQLSHRSADPGTAPKAARAGRRIGRGRSGPGCQLPTLTITQLCKPPSGQELYLNYL